MESWNYRVSKKWKRYSFLNGLKRKVRQANWNGGRKIQLPIQKLDIFSTSMDPLDG